MTGALRRTARNVVIGGLVAAGALVAAPGAAHAALSGCGTDIVGDRQGIARCSVVNSGSHFRVNVTCTKLNTGASRHIYGGWVYVYTGTSSATCLITEYAENAVVDRVN
jgi:hypothetical protein